MNAGGNGDGGTEFRPHLLPLFLFFAVWGALLSAGALFFLPRLGRAMTDGAVPSLEEQDFSLLFSKENGPLVAIAFFVFSFLLARAMQSMYTVTLTQDSVRGRDALGFACTMTFAEISKRSRVNVLGLSFLRITSRATRRRLWLPLFVDDASRFVEL